MAGQGIAEEEQFGFVVVVRLAVRDDFADDDGAAATVFQKMSSAFAAGAESFEWLVGFLLIEAGSIERGPAVEFLAGTWHHGHHVKVWSLVMTSTLGWPRLVDLPLSLDFPGVDLPFIGARWLVIEDCTDLHPTVLSFDGTTSRLLRRK